MAESCRCLVFVSTNFKFIIVELPLELDKIIVKATIAMLTDPNEERRRQFFISRARAREKVLEARTMKSSVEAIQAGLWVRQAAFCSSRKVNPGKS